jgi:hypothetical protein
LFIAFHVATMHRWGFHLLYEITGMNALKGYEDAGLFHSDGHAFQSTAAAIRSYWSSDNIRHPASGPSVIIWQTAWPPAPWHGGSR